jgi:copper chaperone CopZ
MIRRRFMQQISLVGAGGLACMPAIADSGSQTVIYRIKGFSCVTCAVGLETMLRQQKGVVGAKTSYPDAKATIDFDPKLVAESWLRAFIADKGFTVDEETRK